MNQKKLKHLKKLNPQHNSMKLKKKFERRVKSCLTFI